MSMELTVSRLTAELRDELDLPIEKRPTRASDDSIYWAVERANEALNLLNAGRSEEAANIMNEISHMAIDSWNLRASLVEQIVGCAQLLRGDGDDPK